MTPRVFGGALARLGSPFTEMENTAGRAGLMCVCGCRWVGRGVAIISGLILNVLKSRYMRHSGEGVKL